MENTKICICGSFPSEINGCVAERDKKVYKAFLCKSCGTKSIFPKETQVYYDNVYSKKKKSIKSIHNDQLKMKSLWDEYVIEILSNFNVKSAFDFGAYAGYLLKELRQNGWNVEGVEINPIFVKYAKIYNNIILNQNSIFSNHLTSVRTGLSLCTEVLDHMVDPHSVINIMRTIAPYSYITVRDSESFNKYDYFTHLWYFTEKGMRDLLAKYNLQKLTVNRVNTEFGGELRLFIEW